MEFADQADKCIYIDSLVDYGQDPAASVAQAECLALCPAYREGICKPPADLTELRRELYCNLMGGVLKGIHALSAYREGDEVLQLVQPSPIHRCPAGWFFRGSTQRK